MEKEMMIELAASGVSKKQHRHDIVRHLCSYGTLAWAEAEAIVVEAEQNHTPKGNMMMLFFLLILGIVGIISVAGLLYMI